MCFIIIHSMFYEGCHASGSWGGRVPTSGNRRGYFDLFVRLAAGFPPWRVPRAELMERVWGRPGGHPAGAGGDPCLRPASRCIRALVVARGALAKQKRTVANLDEALERVLSGLGPDEVRIAVVQMELFTLAEEVPITTIIAIIASNYSYYYYYSYSSYCAYYSYHSYYSYYSNNSCNS